jgi:hypothetical protein
VPQDTYRQALGAADEVYRVANELASDESRSKGQEEEFRLLSGVIEPYRTIRDGSKLALIPKDVGAALEAADELSDWLQDFMDVQVEPTTEQVKSLMGVMGALQHYEKVRSRVVTRAERM